MSDIVHNPATPYIGQIPGGVHDGMQIHVSGTAEHHHTGFLISLQENSSIDPRGQCPFVFNPRFNENAVIRNSLQGSSWGAEERHGGFPFHKGQHFDVTIAVKNQHYRVSVNGRHFCDYNHRMRKEQCHYITVEQGIRISKIRFEHGYPAAQGYPGPSGYPGQAAGPIYNPPVPFVQNMPGGLYPNKMIYISGIPHPNPGRFTVYLQHGPHHEPRDIAICIDARFVYNNDRSVVVRNSCQHGGWGAEERHCPYFPFMPNASFDMMILVEPGQFKVAVNNQHLLEFYHRIQPLNRIDTLRIDGDVRLTQIRFQ